MTAYNNPEQSFASIVEYQKLHPLRQSIDQLTDEISKRRGMLDDNLQSLEYREVELDSLIMRLHQAMPFGYIAFLTSKTRQTFEGNISDLKRERNKELVTYWKDVIRLKQDLQEKLAEYGQAKGMLGPQRSKDVSVSAASTSSQPDTLSQGNEDILVAPTDISSLVRIP